MLFGGRTLEIVQGRLSLIPVKTFLRDVSLSQDSWLIVTVATAPMLYQDGLPNDRERWYCGFPPARRRYLLCSESHRSRHYCGRSTAISDVKLEICIICAVIENRSVLNVSWGPMEHFSPPLSPVWGYKWTFWSIAGAAGLINKGCPVHSQHIC